MKRLMVMGAAIEQVPGIKKAKEMGYEVAVVDYNPKAIGVPLADKFYNVSTIDPEGVLQAARDFHTEGILTLATDLPMRAVAYANENLGLPGVSQHTAFMATDKGEMIKALKAHNIESPWYFIVDSLDGLSKLKEHLSFPCIIKPTDNAASRGVVLVHNLKELKSAYEYSQKASHSGQVIIEEYMEGPEVSVEVLVYKGTPHVLQITDKMTSGAPHFVEIGHDQPTSLSTGTQDQIRDIAKRAVMALGIKMGPAHVEIIVTKEGPKIVELGARLGGDCITSHLVYLSTGIDMIKETIKVVCGEEPNLISEYEKGATIRFLTGKIQGIFDSVKNVEKARAIPGIVEIENIMRVGELIGMVKSSDDRVAYVIAQGETVREASEIAEKAISMMKVYVR